MASYKSAIRSTPTNGQPEPKLKDKAQQLQEFFPSWSYDDLQSLLAEVNGDVELAATRISDGKAEQWGSVSRKKDKKAGHTSKDSFSSTPSPRGDSRGGRGGARGGRGGHARGGAVRSRGDFRGARGGHTNGHVSRTSSPAVGQHVDNKAGDAPTRSIDAASEVTPSSSQISTRRADAKSEEPSDSSTWGGPSTWSTTELATDNNFQVNVNGSTSGSTNQPTVLLSAKQISKSPATSKLSWAQIARPQEKSVPPAPMVQHLPPQSLANAIHPAASHESITVNDLPSTSAPVPALPESESITNTGWEDPTTGQTPSFEEEPAVPEAPSDRVKEPDQKAELEAVSPLKESVTSKPLEDPVVEQPAELVIPASPNTALSKVAARPTPISQRNSARYSNYAKIANDQGGVVMPPTPSSIGAGLSGISSFGSFGELKSAGLEKVGMQFGSLSLGGTSEPESEPEPAPAPPAEAPTTPITQASVSAPDPISIATPPPSSSLNTNLYQSQSQPIQASVSQPAVSSSAVTPVHISNSPAEPLPQSVPSMQPHLQPPSLPQLPQQLQQQASQAQSQALPSHHHYTQLSLPTHVDQPSQSQAQTQSPPQQVQQAQSYLRQNDQSPYGSSVSTSVSASFHHSSTPPTQDNNGYGTFGSVLSSQSLGSQGLGIAGQGLSSMGQGALGGMGGLGGMSGLGGQGLGHQQQQSLSAFDSYGYEGGQRNFYDSYQPNVFGRGVLGHDDLKGSIPSQQQTQQAPSTNSTGTSTSLPPSANQSSVQQSQQSPATSVSSSAQAQPQPGQGPAPGYHPAAPVPYYYQPFPQNSYYGAAAMGAPSNYGYGVGGMGVPQPYPGMNVGKYPTIYPGPPGSAPSPAGKPSPGMGVHGHGGVIGHGGLGVQPQSYGGGLYGQQQSYDDYQHHTQHQQQGHQHHNSHGLGLGQDYSKQLYGAQAGLQGYMGGAGGGAGPAGVASGSGAGPRSGTSPETAYKPYAPKDVGVGRGNVQQNQGQGQGQSQGQGQGQNGQGGGPQGQGFYGGNRFGSASSVGGGVAPQQSAHGAPLYPQGQSDAGYYYQQRQQQYWQ